MDSNDLKVAITMIVCVTISLIVGIVCCTIGSVAESNAKAVIGAEKGK